VLFRSAYEKNTLITDVDAANAIDDVIVFHAGTALGSDKSLRAIGGRVLNVTAIGATRAAAADSAYAGVDAINWPGGFFRRDIARPAD